MARILLVEDSPTQAVEITMLLESASHEVTHAGNGALGLAELRRHSPDLVITDLEMPEVNGLQLVESMRVDFSHVPTILVTSHGSEDLAAEALRSGAAGYVPKNRMADLLNDTIVDVLGVIRTDESYERLISTLRENVFVFELPNDPILISPLVGLLMQVSSGMELLSSIEMVRLGVAVEHAIANAMCHGNLDLTGDQIPRHHEMARQGKLSELMQERLQAEPYKSRTVRVHATATMESIRIVITDQGNGFDTSIVPAAGDANVQGFSGEGFSGEGLGDSEESQQGQGLVLMSNFVDELTFNKAGNEVTLVKRCQAKD